MSHVTIAKECIRLQAEAINQILDLPETVEFNRLVGVLTQVATSNYARRIIMAGVGKNANIAAKISETMASLGLPSFYLNVSHTGHGDFGFVGPYDVIIHISRSGQTREMMAAIDHIKLIRPQVQQALIHCKRGKPFNDNLDFELFIGDAKEGDEHGLAPTTSTTMLLCALDALSVAVSHNIGFRRLDFLKFHPDGALGDLLKKEMTELAFNETQDAPLAEDGPGITPEIKKQLRQQFKMNGVNDNRGKFTAPVDAVQEVQPPVQSTAFIEESIVPVEEVSVDTGFSAEQLNELQQQEKKLLQMFEAEEQARISSSLKQKEAPTSAYLGQTPDDLADRKLF